MLSSANIMQLIQSLIWLLAGVGVFIVGMSFMSDALEKSAGEGMKKMLGRISNNRFSGVGIGASVTAIIQSSSATSVMVIGLVNAGVMTLMQATPIIMGANIGTTITGVLVALKNDYFNMLMYLFAFAGVMMGFFKKEKIKIAGLLCSGLGLIFVGLNVMSSEQAFGNPLVESMFQGIFSVIDFPLLLILVGVIFTALLQSSSAATGVVITMVGTGVLPIDLALFIVLGANIGTCVTALLASVGANANSKRVALIHFTFNVIGTVIFTAFVWLFKEPIINLLVSLFPGSDPMSLQMRISVFHVIFNVTTTVVLLPFVKQLVQYSCAVIRDKQEKSAEYALKYVDERLLSMPSVALMQAKKEIDYMLSLVEENVKLSAASIAGNPLENSAEITRNEEIIDFTNGALTKFLIKLSACVDERDEQRIGSYFHVLNDLERVGDHAENFYEIGLEMRAKKISFSDTALSDIKQMYDVVINMINVAKEAFDAENPEYLPALSKLENDTDEMKRSFSAKHFSRLSEGNCSLEVSPYYTSTITGLERVADHIVNVGYSICNPVGDDDNNY
ncbi:MAG: Na/Pi cotransporter family protein [Oscillospiraceae bacterium]|nr:Na/Pi cotransporter family protein [Oscillospiraceae bacterium]